EELARIVFADSAARQKLEAILHPRIREVWERETQIWRKEGLPSGAVLIPLLFETGASSLFDKTICVACSLTSQFQRLRERGWKADEIKRRIESQWSIDKKINLSNFVVWTDTTVAAHAAQLKKLFKIDLV